MKYLQLGSSFKITNRGYVYLCNIASNYENFKLHEKFYDYEGNEYIISGIEMFRMLHEFNPIFDNRFPLLIKNEKFEVTVSGEELNRLPNLSYDYIENIYLEMETDREYKKNTKNYYVPKHNYKLTYKVLQDYVMEHYCFKVHSVYIAEIKRNVGLDMQADRHNRKRKYECPKEKADAIEEALRYFKVI